MGIHIDASELNALGAALGAVGKEALPIARVAVQKTSADIKADAQAFAPVDTGALKNSITYSTKELATAVEGEIGPTVKYGKHVEFGTSRMAPRAYLGPAFDRRAHTLEAALGQIADRFSV